MFLPPEWLFPLSSCLYLHPSTFLCQFCLLYCLLLCPASLAGYLFLCLYICLIFFPPLWTLEHHSCVRLRVPTFFVFFFLCPTSSFCSVPSSSLPVLIWKCFGLQLMMVDFEEIKEPCGSNSNLFKIPFKQLNKSTKQSAITVLD